MHIKEILNMENAESMESALLAAIEDKSTEFGDLIHALPVFESKADATRADFVAEMLEGSANVTVNKANLLAVLAFRARLNNGKPDLREKTIRRLESLFPDRPSQNMLKAAFIDGVEVSECIRRFSVLKSITAGVYCYDKAWGFGVVKKVDDFYQKISVDFSVKKDHLLVFAYAGEKLTVLGKDHILVVKHEKPDEIARLIKEDPAQIVVMLLNSFGPLNIEQTKQMLAKSGILPESQWKELWDKARPQLKKSAKVDIPASRNDPLRLILDAGKLADEKLSAFKALRDPKAILDFIEKSNREGTASGDATAMLIVEKFLYAVDVVKGKDPALLARLLSLAGSATVVVPSESLRGAAEWVMTPAVFVQAADSVPAKTLALLLKLLILVNEQKLMQAIVHAVCAASASTINECVLLTTALGKSDEVFARLRELSLEKNPPKETLIWIAGNMDCAVQKLNYSETAILALIRMLVDSDYEGMPARTRNAARRLFDEQEFLDGLLGKLSPHGKKECVTMLGSAMLWPESDRRGVLARLMKANPDVKNIIEEHAAASDAVVKPAARWTSYRSYRERSEYYKKLTTVDIPKNSKDIAEARSYGDLKENHEYKSAKEQQAVLMRRKDETEVDLDTVKATDFEKANLTTVGQGTCVTVQRPDGSQQTFCLLGEWDRDEKLLIVSSKSRLGQTLCGKVVGDEVVLTDESGHKEETCKVISISGLTDEIKLWIRG